MEGERDVTVANGLGHFPHERARLTNGKEEKRFGLR